MDSAKQQLTDKLKTANNILVTVSRNPSVDQLASCIGLTLLLNKQGKHAAAVFSGEVPSTLEFLQPEDTLEKNTDSLRDFIIALDKSKADKLRYKVEDNVVRIFITPYKTSISEADLEFSEGDFNVDLVITLGVRKQEDLDEAITAHGRILHDATVASINIEPDGGLGTINWYDPQASSLSELITDLAAALGQNLLDTQIATALLTGIVSETDRFSNDKTSSQTMSASATLMAAGANQQLVASKLEGSVSLSLSDQPDGGSGGTGGDPSSNQPTQNDDGTIEIKHYDAPPDQNVAADSPVGEANSEAPNPDNKDPLTLPSAMPGPTEPPAANTNLSPGAKLMTEPPTLSGTLTANSTEEQLDRANDPLGLPSTDPPQLLDRKTGAFGSAPARQMPAALTPETLPPLPSSNQPSVSSGFTPAPPTWVPPPSTDQPNPATASQPTDDSGRTLTELEESVNSPHTDDSENLDMVRDEVNRALDEAAATETAHPEPIQALNAQSLGDDLHPAATDAASSPQAADPSAPPPVPPPIPFQFGNPPTPQQ